MAILGDSDDEDNKPLRSRRGGGGRSKQSRTSISNPEPVAAFPQPPKERPDARHHLKVFQHYHSLILIMIVKVIHREFSSAHFFSIVDLRERGTLLQHTKGTKKSQAKNF